MVSYRYNTVSVTNGNRKNKLALFFTPIASNLL